MNAAQIKELKACVEKLKASPELLHDKDLAFFRSYIEGLGGKIPDLPKKKADAHSHSHAEPERGHGHGHAHGEDCCGHDHGHADHGHVRESDSNPCAPRPSLEPFIPYTSVRLQPLKVRTFESCPGRTTATPTTMATRTSMGTRTSPRRASRSPTSPSPPRTPTPT